MGVKFLPLPMFETLGAPPPIVKIRKKKPSFYYFSVHGPAVENKIGDVERSLRNKWFDEECIAILEEKKKRHEW